MPAPTLNIQSKVGLSPYQNQQSTARVKDASRQMLTSAAEEQSAQVSHRLNEMADYPRQLIQRFRV